MESEVLPGGVAGKWKMSTAEEAGRNEEPNGESALKIYVAGTSTQVWSIIYILLHCHVITCLAAIYLWQ